MVNCTTDPEGATATYMRLTTFTISWYILHWRWGRKSHRMPDSTTRDSSTSLFSDLKYMRDSTTGYPQAPSHKMDVYETCKSSCGWSYTNSAPLLITLFLPKANKRINRVEKIRFFGRILVHDGSSLDLARTAISRNACRGLCRRQPGGRRSVHDTTPYRLQSS